MAGEVLSWGKPTLEIIKLIDRMIPVSGVWLKLDTPVNNTTKLTPTEGSKKEALEEGGGVVDTYREKNKLTLTFDLFVKEGVEKPIDDEDGSIEGNYAIRLTPENPKVKGFMLPKCAVNCGTNYATEEGMKLTYTFDALVPEDGGRMLRDYYGIAAKTLSIRDISNLGATFEGSYSTKGTVTEVGFSYKKKSASTWIDLPSPVTTTPFTEVVTGLEPITNYEMKAFVKMGGSRYEGNVISFTTKA